MSVPGAWSSRFRFHFTHATEAAPIKYPCRQQFEKDFLELFCGTSAFGLWQVLRACLTRPEDICGKAGVHATLGVG